MSISCVCAGCGKPFRIGDEFAGKRVRCKACGSVTPIPSSSSELPELDLYGLDEGSSASLREPEPVASAQPRGEKSKKRSVRKTDLPVSPIVILVLALVAFVALLVGMTSASARVPALVVEIAVGLTIFLIALKPMSQTINVRDWPIWLWILIVFTTIPGLVAIYWNWRKAPRAYGANALGLALVMAGAFVLFVFFRPPPRNSVPVPQPSAEPQDVVEAPAATPPISPLVEPPIAKPTTPGDPVLSLLYRLKSAKSTDRTAAQDSLEQMTPVDRHRAAVIAAIIPNFDDKNPLVRRNAVVVFAKWSPADADVSTRLIACLKDSNTFVVSAAMKELVDRKDIRALDAITEMLDDFLEQSTAMVALKDYGPIAEDAVIKSLSHPKARVRSAACTVLDSYQVGTAKCLSALEKASQDPDPSVATTARGAYESIKARSR